MERNYEFFMKADLDSYVGQWIAVCREKIIAHGKDVKTVFKEAKATCPNERPLITRIPDKETTIF